MSIWHVSDYVEFKGEKPKHFSKMTTNEILSIVFVTVLCIVLTFLFFLSAVDEFYRGSALYSVFHLVPSLVCLFSSWHYANLMYRRHKWGLPMFSGRDSEE